MNTLVKPSHQKPPMPSWRDTLKTLWDWRVLCLLAMGFSAGIPILLIFSSLSLWLGEAGVERKALTFFSWAALGYSFKFVWAPLVDRLPLPLLGAWLGRRRSWMLLAQCGVVLAILGMASTDPAAGEDALTRMAMFAVLGIPTSRALSVTGSDQGVMRETVETSAVVLRMAPTLIRFGSFEHWSSGQQPEQLKVLADYVIDRFYPQLRTEENPYAAFLAEVTRRTAELMAQWQAVGFMHGVMNTDNMSILGETLDYGPFGFMEAFDSGHICNHSDQQGRYAYGMQPQIGHWNCYALGQALLPLINEVPAAQAALDVYQPAFAAKMDALLHAKLGLATEQDGDRELMDAMFALLQENHADFTLFFRTLSNLKTDTDEPDHDLRDEFINREAFDAWAVRYRARLRAENSDDAARKVAMDAVNPKYVLRNYLAQVAIEKAQNKDFTEIERLLSVLLRPFDEQPENERYAALPPDWASHLE
eukprot:gene11022-12852_t